MCESCRLKRIDAFYARGAELPDTPHFITTSQKKYCIEYDCFTESFFLIEITKRQLGRDCKRTILPISCCPHCGQKLNEIDTYSILRTAKES